MKISLPAKFIPLSLVSLAVALAWGIRGQHGHERGGAVVGAMAGLSLAALTGGPRWVGAAVMGSLCFSIGGSLSYGRFVVPASQGSLEALGALALIGAVWGGLGALGLGLGLSLSKYRGWERTLLFFGLFIIWVVVDRMLWVRMTGPDDLRTREMMALFLAAVWLFLIAYVGLLRSDTIAVKLGVAGAAGFGLGFPLASWVFAIGTVSGIGLDWWKVGEHVIGFCGGLAVGWAGLSLENSWRRPARTRPLERLSAFIWLFWLLPTWLIANNLDFWIQERAVLPVEVGKVVWSLVFLMLIVLALWGWTEIRRGRTFVTSWMPRHLKAMFLTYLWTVTLIASCKTWLIGIYSPTPFIFLGFAILISLILRPQFQIRPQP